MYPKGIKYKNYDPLVSITAILDLRDGLDIVVMRSSRSKSLFDTFEVYCSIRSCIFKGKMPSALFRAFKMGSLLRYQIGIIPTVSFVSLGCASGTNTPRV